MNSSDNAFLAIFIAEALSNRSQDDSLFEESFVVIGSTSIEEALDAARRLVGQQPPYTSVTGSEITWTRRLVSVGPISLPIAQEGEIYSRFFRNGQAYAELDFEDFEPDQDTELHATS